MDWSITFVDLRSEEIEHARRLTPSQKLALGGELFDAAREVMVSGIRMQNPSFDDEQVRHEVARRLALARRLETRL
jgi:phage terminase large subunit-like protein